MPNVSRPDLLPFAKPARIGLPYHGLVRSGLLTCADSTTMTYPQPSIAGDEDAARAILVRGRSPDTTVLTEQNAKRRWQNYALLSGKNRSIGAQELTLRSWLYADAAGYTWKVRYLVEKDGSSFILSVYLTSSFGIMSDASRSMSERLLGQHTFSSVHPYTGAVTEWNRSSTSKSSHSQYGDCSVVWVTHNDSMRFAGNDAIKITLSGDGALSGTVGSGISVAFTHLGTAKTLTPRNVVNAYDGAQIQWIAARPGGAISEVSYEAETVYGAGEWIEIDGTYWFFRDVSGFVEVIFSGVYNWRNDYAWSEKWSELDPTGTYEITAGCKPKTVGIYQQNSNADVFEVSWALCLGDPTTYTVIHTDLGKIRELPNPLTTSIAVDPGTGAFMAADNACYV